MPQKSINELHKFYSQLMSVAMHKHLHWFFGDFDALLAEQVQKFNFQEFERFITTFQEYKLRDDTYQTADDVVKLFALFADTFKYDALILSTEKFRHTHPIWTIPVL